MSENNKDLGDKAEEAFDKAKEAAKDAAEDAKEAASDFKEDVKEVFSSDNPDAGKNIAIIAHITIIGWIIALVMNSPKKELASFYIRQVLGLALLGIILSFIPVIGWIASIGVFVLWLMSLIYSVGGKEKEIPILGSYFQDWFKSL
ncbi:MAG: YtxH domain-containing protein [Bacteroidota bacterium]